MLVKIDIIYSYGIISMNYMIGGINIEDSINKACHFNSNFK